jgi:hypothetical protein
MESEQRARELDRARAAVDRTRIERKSAIERRAVQRKMAESPRARDDRDLRLQIEELERRQQELLLLIEELRRGGRGRLLE